MPSARKQLRDLLDRRLAAVDRDEADVVAQIDAEVARRFERPLAVMITDTSGFTAQTKAHGVTSFLMKMRRLFRIAQPIILRHGAELVKVDADDLFVVADSADALLQVARDLLAALDEHNAAHADFLGISIGLGYGKTLVIERDIFGDAVNTASKLGEDIGLVSEMLATESFVAALGPENAAACTKVDHVTRGAKLPFYACARAQSFV